MATPKERHDAQPGARSTGWSNQRHPPADALAATPRPAVPTPIPVRPPRPVPAPDPARTDRVADGGAG